MSKTLFLIIAFSLLCLFSQAQEVVTETQNLKTGDLEMVDGIEYMVHIVEPKQTMYAISKKYEISLEELYRINPGADQGISIGQAVYIPLGAKNPVSNKKDDGSYIFHMVRPGETLYSISRIYSQSIDAIKKANPDLETNDLPINYKLRIPWSLEKNENKKVSGGIIASEVKEEKPTVSQSNKSSKKAESGQSKDSVFVYTAKARETLYGISKKFNTSIETLIALNPELINGLKFGQNIYIPKPGFEPVSTEQEQEQVYPYRDSLYVYHKVKQGENLYSLARFYAVAIDELKSINPTLTNDIFVNQIIRFPLTTVVPDYISHTAEKKEKVKNIAKRYDVSVERLERMNPRIGRKIKTGESIRIPLEERHVDYSEIFSVVEEAEEKIQEEETDFDGRSICAPAVLNGQKINIALMLPFYLDQYDENTFHNINEFSKISDFRNFRYLPFYEGAMIALDSLTKLGIDIDLHVYNVSHDLEETKAQLKESAMADIDLIIGILFAKNFRLVSDFARSHGIPLVNAISGRPEIINGNPWVFKVEPSVESTVDMAIDLLPPYNDSAYKVFIVRGNKYQHSGLTLKLKNKINAWSKDDFGYKKNYHELIYMDDSITGFIQQANTSKKNLVFTLSDDKIFILEILRQLNELKDTFDIQLTGFPHWEDVDNIQTEYLQNLKVQIPSSALVDYQSDAMRRFMIKYRGRYNTEPDMLAIKGYDYMMYFAYASAAYGRDFRSCINRIPVKLLHTKLDFRHDHGNGYENTYWNAYKIKNYEIIDLRKYENPDYRFTIDNNTTN